MGFLKLMQQGKEAEGGIFAVVERGECLNRELLNFPSVRFASVPRFRFVYTESE